MLNKDIHSKYRQWLKFKVFIRNHFTSLGLLEVETPTLVEGPAFEAQLEIFATHWQCGKLEKSYYLPTSPELHLKKLLAAGFENIFELKNCFRNGELGPHHQPEFLMLEWYRTQVSLDALIQDLESLFVSLSQQGWLSEPSLKLTTLEELFKEILEFTLQPQTSQPELLELAKAFGLNPDGNENRSELFDWLFVSQIEPKLDKKVPTIIQNYPSWTPTLAKVNEQGWASRFELYFGGFEIANAFQELTNYQEHEGRWREICKLRNENKLEPLARDNEFFAVIKNGLPESSGIALGMERLFMACQGISSINQFKPFAKDRV